MKVADGHRVEVSHCPACNKMLDGASQVSKSGENARPKPGDLTVCINCATELEFIAGGQLQVLSSEARRRLPAETIETLDLIRRALGLRLRNN